MATTRRTTTRALAPLAALALAATACGGLDLARTETTASEQSEDEDIADPEAGAEDQGPETDATDPEAGAEDQGSETDGEDTDTTQPPDTDAADDAEEVATPDTDDGEPTPDAGSNLETGEQDDDGSEGSGRATPQDLDLDLTQRHPGGALLEVGAVRFEGNTVLIDAEFINGATRDIRITTSGGNSLRLQDNVGNTYNFVEPDDVDRFINLAQGETISGEFAFLGPVDPRAENLVLIVNLYDPVNLPMDPDSLYDGTRTPEFAVEDLELSW